MPASVLSQVRLKNADCRAVRQPQTVIHCKGQEKKETTNVLCSVMLE